MTTVEDFAFASMSAGYAGHIAQYRAQVARFEREAAAIKYRMELQRMMAPPKVKPVVTKCPACGSHEFRTHNLVRICSYCRCGQ